MPTYSYLAIYAALWKTLIGYAHLCIYNVYSLFCMCICIYCMYTGNAVFSMPLSLQFRASFHRISLKKYIYILRTYWRKGFIKTYLDYTSYIQFICNADIDKIYSRFTLDYWYFCNDLVYPYFFFLFFWLFAWFQELL